LQIAYSRKRRGVRDKRRTEADRADARVYIGMGHIPLGVLDCPAIVVDGRWIHCEAVGSVIFLSGIDRIGGRLDERDGRAAGAGGEACDRRIPCSWLGCRPVSMG
jgi:hypothetical protein